MIIQEDFKFVKDNVKYNKYFHCGIPSQYWNSKFSPIFTNSTYVNEDKNNITFTNSSIQIDWWNNVSRKLLDANKKISIGIYSVNENLSLKALFCIIKNIIINEMKCCVKNVISEYNDLNSQKIDVVGLCGNYKRDTAYMSNCLRSHLLNGPHCIFSYGGQFNEYVNLIGIKPTIAITINKEE